jgi:CubicO group peptidase (beta-lactamase class C family)
MNDAFQSSGAADLSPLLKELLESHRTPGMVAAILDAQRITAIGAAGMRKAGFVEALQVQDAVHLGSCTKAMTALLVAQMIEIGGLAYATPLSEIFPEFVAEKTTAAARLTVERLLAHTAGLPRNADWKKYESAGSPAEGRRALLKDVLAGEIASSTERIYTYSNVGYILLGAILEQKTGCDWEALMRKSIFTPLGMSSAGFGPPGVADTLDHAWGHHFVDGIMQPVQIDNPPIMAPAGGVHCAISDWARFLMQFLQPETVADGLIAAATRRQLLTPAIGEEYAGGWMVVQPPWSKGPAYTHSGSNTTWCCTAWVAPQLGFATLVAVNSGGDDAHLACRHASSALIRLKREELPNEM